MAKTSTPEAATTGTLAPPQKYRAVSWGVGPFKRGDTFTAEELFPGLDPDFIAGRIPQLLEKGSIVRAEDPDPSPRPS
jgi:hypothetical protein